MLHSMPPGWEDCCSSNTWRSISCRPPNLSVRRPFHCGLLRFGILLATTAAAALAGPAEEAGQIASLAGFHGGLVIHVGCGDGQLTAALRLADNCVVQGLEADAKRVETARAAIRALGLYGPVSVMHWSGKKLPYVDNLATLVVCEDAGAVPADELMRVLRPHGAAVVKRDGKWTVTVKPPLPGTDEWEQHFHGADNNAVAQDTVVGPPRRYQWLGEPQWQRSHLAMPSINSMVSTKGRLFTVEDLGSAEHPALPGKQALVARDAYNGVVLWRVMFSDWHPIYIRNKEMPVQLQRRLAAVGDVVYCTPGYSAPITVFDAATGAVMQEARADRGDGGVRARPGRPVRRDGRPVRHLARPSPIRRVSALNTSLFRREAYGPIDQRACRSQERHPGHRRRLGQRALENIRRRHERLRRGDARRDRRPRGLRHLDGTRLPGPRDRQVALACPRSHRAQPGGVPQSLDPQHLRHWSAPVQRPVLCRAAVLRVLQQRHAERTERAGGGAGLHQIAGHVELPAPRTRHINLPQWRRQARAVPIDQTPVRASLRDLGPLLFRQVRRSDEEPLFNALLRSTTSWAMCNRWASS